MGWGWFWVVGGGSGDGVVHLPLQVKQRWPFFQLNKHPDDQLHANKMKWTSLVHPWQLNKRERLSYSSRQKKKKKWAQETWLQLKVSKDLNYLEENSKGAHVISIPTKKI